MNKITFENVTKQFDSKVAVTEVSFEIPTGKVYGLLGPNGAGKTTLIRMLMDIIKPDSGGRGCERRRRGGCSADLQGAPQDGVPKARGKGRDKAV
jgi:ABC-type uncharacterized transport system ATPase subunit